MKLFRRKSSTTSNVPPEVAEYYQAERRDRTGMAWLMTLFALLVTVIIVLGLFLAGRWLYRTIRSDDTPTTTQTESQNDSDQNQGSNQRNNGSDGNNDDRSNIDSSEPRSETSEDSSDEQTETESETTREPETNRDAARNEETQDNADESAVTAPDELSNTGPGETAAVLFGVAAIGVYVARTRRLQQR